ncbi:MAG: acyltransferase, partial [Pseudomonadota bacterium]
SNSLFGPMIEDEWNLFTAKMIRMSGARVVPLFFPGANSRWYQMANQISPTLRQSLLIHEVVNACGKPQKPVIGHPFDAAEVKERLKDQRACMDWMREETLKLKE